jgi:microcystin degradation protein MlrC
MTRLRYFVAGLMHEANRFSPVPTPLAAFAAWGGKSGHALAATQAADAVFGYGDLLQAVHAAGGEAVQGAYYVAGPSAPVSAGVFKTLCDALAASLQQALADGGRIDGVLLFLHGAMVAEGCDDCEGTLLARLREVTAPRALPTGVLLDLHGNATPAMCHGADVLLACREYPHTDFGVRAAELVALISGIAARQCRPWMRLARLPMAGLLPTDGAPGQAVLQAMAQAEGVPGVLSVSVFHGFAWSDHAHVGASVLLVGQGDVPQAQTLMQGLATQFAQSCDAHWRAHPVCSVDEALDQALSPPAADAIGPVVLADRSDNPGGGGSGDTTWLLHALQQRGVGGAALGPFHDPAAVAQAHSLGVGAVARFNLGGAHATSGPPFAARMRVLCCRSDARQRIFGTGPWEPLGCSAALQVCGEGDGTGSLGLIVIVNQTRTQTFSRHVFTEHGLDPTALQLLVVKSTSHFLRDFAPLARAVVFCDAPGAASEDLRSLPFSRVPRPLWPLDEMALAQRGALAGPAQCFPGRDW